MTTLIINGTKVTVSDNFTTLSPEDQAKAVDDIAKSLPGKKATAPAENVVATTKDGGRIIKADDGSLSFASPNYSTSDPEKVKALMDGATAAESSMASFDKSTMDQLPTGVASAAKFIQGVPFVGEYADEAIGKVFGQDAQTAVRAGNAAMDRQYPKTSAGLQITGGVTTAIPMAMAAAPAIIAAAPQGLAAKIGLGALTAATGGGIEGFVSGYGAGDDGDRMASATERGKLGVALGGVLGAAGPLVGKGLKATFEWAKQYDVNTIAKVLGIDKGAARMIKAGLSSDDPAKALAALNRSGPDAMLADAGPGMAQLLDTSMQSSGAAARVGMDRIGARAANAAKRISGTFDNLLGKADAGIKTAAKAIADRTSKLRGDAYEKAFSLPIDYASEAGRAIDGVVARVPKDMLSRAVKSANDAMQMDGRTAKQIMASIADDGTVTFSKPLDVFQLNELKKQIGEMGRNAVDQFGRATGEGIRLRGLERDLARAMGEAVPEYKAAVALGGDKIAEDRALELGQKMLSPQVTREAVVEGLRDASKDAVAAAKRGLRNYIDETMANVRSVISDPNVDAREAMTMVRSLSSRASKDKMTALLGKKANMLFDAIDEAAAHLELRAATARNSATAARTATQDAAKRAVGDTTMDAVRDGRPINAVQRLVQSITGGSEARKAEALNKLYTDLAKALTGPRGAEAKKAMATIEKALAGQPMKTQDAEEIARLVTTGAGLLGYQSGTQLLGTQQGVR